MIFCALHMPRRVTALSRTSRHTTKHTRPGINVGSDCVVFNCFQKATGGLCDAHAACTTKWSNDRSSLHRTHNWRLARADFLANHPLCGTRADGGRHKEHSRCARSALLVRASVVDHIHAHSGDWDEFWDSRNWQTSLKWNCCPRNCPRVGIKSRNSPHSP